MEAFVELDMLLRAGLTARVEAEVFRLNRQLAGQLASGEGTMPYDRETHTWGAWQPSREWVDPELEAEALRLSLWLEATEDQLPVWYSPRYRERVQNRIEFVFREISQELNDVITERRDLDAITSKAILEGEQKAYERCRRKLFHVLEDLVYRDRSRS